MEMHERWKAHFPKDMSEALGWKRYTRHHALAMRVLAVAHTRVEGAWCAYIDAVPGMNHDYEQDEVFNHGDKLGEAIARALFPEFDTVPYAN